MKHRLLSLLFASLLAVSGFSAITYSLNESFEEGIPATWSQEVVSGPTGGVWILDTLATNPNGAAHGQKRVALRANGGTNYDVRLITPALDLSTVSNPQLAFAYAQVRRSSYSDTLSVYYRTSSTSAWQLITKFGAYKGTWTAETIDLPAAVRVNGCQLAFEGKTNNGYGVVLDNVRIFPESQCNDAVISGVVVGSTQALINWQAIPGRTFELIVSASAIADLASYNTSEAAYHSNTLTGAGQLVSGLSSATKYYVYLRTDCDDNESGYTNWVSSDFTTSIGIPYHPNLAAIPSTWTQYSGAAGESVQGGDLSSPNSSYKWSASSNTSILGEAHLYAQPSGSVVPWITTPAIDFSSVEQGTNIALSFKLAVTSGSSNTTASSDVASAKLHIYVSQDAGATWARISTISGSDLSNVARTFNVLLNDYVEESIRLAFVAESGSYSNYFHLGNVWVNEVDPSCLGLRGLKAIAAKDQISLSWNVVGSNTNAVAVISTSATFADTLETKNIAATSVQFTGLTPNTQYYLSVRQDCEGGDVLTVSKTTLCEPTTISAESPWSEGFEGYNGAAYNANGVMPDCWSASSTGSIAPHVIGSGSFYYKHSGTKALTFYGSGYNYAVLPPFSNALNTLKLSFWMQTESTSSGSLVLGYITADDDNMSTFDTIAVYQNSTSMVQRTTDLSEVPDNAAFLVFRWYYSGQYSCCIDDVSLELLPNCRQVQNVSVASITESSAQVGFNLNNATQYEVLVVSKAMNPDTLSTESLIAFRDTVSTSPVAISNLAPTTTYYVYVRALCGAEEQGEWSEAVSFTTPCSTMTLPWIENFNSISTGVPNCWDNTEGTSSGSNRWSSYSSGQEGKCLRFNSYFNSSGNTSYLATPAINLSKPATLSFYWKNPAGGDGEVLISKDGGATRTSLKNNLTGVTSWTQYEIDLSDYTGETVIIYFLGISNYGDGDAYLYLDEVAVEAIPTCQKMGAVSLLDATSNSATLNFEATNASQYQVVIATKSINLDSIEGNAAVVYNQLVVSTQPVIPSLESNTRYYAYVRGFCGDEDYSTWAAEFSFKTLCTAITPAAFGTENFSARDALDCWTLGFTTPGSSTSSAYAKRDSIKAYGAYLKLSKESIAYTKNAAGVDTVYSDGAYAVSQELDVEDLSAYQISFSAATTSQAATNYKRLNVGVLASPNDFSDLQIVKTIDLDYAADSTALKSYTISFANIREDYLGRPIRYVIFQLNEPQKHDSTNYALIDNIYFEAASTCEQIVENKIDSIGVHGASISWENSGAAEYQVMVATVNSLRPDTISAPAFTDKVSTNKAVISGLESNTQYFAYVRAICGAGDSAKWSNAASFRTAIEVPWTEPFNANSLSEGWQSLYGSFSGDSVLTTSLTAPTGEYYWSVIKAGLPTGMTAPAMGGYIDDYDYGYPWLISPTIDMSNLSADQFVELTFDLARSTDTESDAKFYVVISEDGGETWKKANATKWESGGDYDFNAIPTTATGYAVGLSKYIGKKIAVAFYFQSPYGYSHIYHYVYVDNVSIHTFEAVCRGVNKVSVAPTAESAKVIWEIEGTPVKAAVMISDTANFATYIDSVGVEDAYEYTFSNLTPNTQYYVRVKQLDCENAEWKSISFTTECLPITTLPWSEDFESYTGGSSYSVSYAMSADCWKNEHTVVVNGYTDYTNYRYYVYTSANGGNSTNQLCLPDMSAGNITLLTLPTFAIDEADAYQFMLDVFRNATSYQQEGLRIYASNASTLDATATELAFISRNYSVTDTTGTTIIPAEAASGWYTYALNIPLEGDVRIFVQGESKYGSSTYMDNFVVRHLPGCPDMKGIAVTGIVADSALISVPDLGAAGYHFIVANATINVDSLSEADAAKIIANDSIMGDTTLLVTGLKSATDYYVYVRALCEDNKVGAWSDAFAFKSACGIIEVRADEPWRVNFDSYATGSYTSGFGDPCWINNHTVVSNASGSYATDYTNYKFYVTTSSNGNTTQQLCLPDMRDGNITLLATPELNVDEADAYEFLIDVYRNASGTSSPQEGVRIFASLSDTIDASAVELAFISRNKDQASGTVIPAEASTGWYTYALSIPLQGDIRILVQGESKYGSATYLDNFIVRHKPSCFPVQGLSIDAITTDSARIQFAKATDEATYDIAVASAELDMYHLSAADSAKIAFSANGVADTAVVADGLKAATSYYVYVRTNCGESGVSEWTDAVAFYTECEAIVITKDSAWSEDFESYKSGDFAAICWSNKHVEGDGTQIFKIYTSTNGTNSTKQLQLPDMYSGTKTLLATPAFSLDEANAYEFLIDVYRNASGTSYPQEGVRIFASLSDTIDASAVELAFISRNKDQASGTVIPAEASTGWYTYALTIPLQGDVRILVQGESKYGSATYLDNFKVSKLPDCIKPTGLSAALTQGDGTIASLSWTSDAAEAWIVQYGTAADFANAVSDTISDTTYVALSGLTPEVTYYARVKTVCEVGVESEWSDAIRFVPTNALTLTIADGTTTNGYVPIYGYYVDALTASQFIIPADSLEALQWDTIKQITFYASESSVDWGTAKFEVYMAEVASTTLSSLESWSSLTKVKNAGSLSIAGNQMVVTLDNPYQYSDGNLLIGFKQTVTGSYMSSTWYGKTIDGVSMGGYGTTIGQQNFLPKLSIDYIPGEEPDCIAPSALKVSAVTATTAEFSFKASKSPEYEFVVTNAVIGPDTLALVADSIIVHRDTVDTAFVALSHLQPSTDYYVYLRGICTDSTASEWASTQFATRCLAAIPYAENFDDDMDRKPVYAGTSSYLIPTCWEEGYDSKSYVSYIQGNTNYNTYAYSGESALKLYSYYYSDYYYGDSKYNTYVVLPEFDASLDTLQLTFKARAMYEGSSVTNYATSSYAHSIKIGTMTDPADFSTFKLLDTYELATVATAPSSAANYWEDVTIYLQGAQGKYIALVSDFDKSNHVWIDDVEVSRAPDCLAPSAVKVAAAARAADVTWNSLATEFEVAFGVAGFALPAGADTIFAVADTAGLHIADLEPSTDYDLYVRAVCGENAHSDWSAVASFSTACVMPEFAEYNFDDAATRYVHHKDSIHVVEEDYYGYSSDEYDEVDSIYMENCWILAGKMVAVNSSSYYSSESGEAGYYPFIIDNSSNYTYARSATGALVFNYTSGANTPLVAAMPALEGDRDSLQLEFWARAGYESYGSMAYASSYYARMLRVGMMTDPSDITTFVPFETIRSEEISGSASDDPEGENYWRRYRYNLAGTTAPFIAFVYDSTASNLFFVDDVRIKKMASCPEPETPIVDNVTFNSAVVRWDTIAPAYQVALINGTDTLKQMVVGNDTLLLENLAAATTYIVKLRAFCSENDSSEWSSSAAFTTECEDIIIAEAGWVENFNELTAGIPLCWDNSEGTTSDSYKWSYYATGYEDAGLRFNSYSNSSGNTNTLVTPRLVLTKDAELTFWWKNPTGGDADLLISTDGGINKTSLGVNLNSIANWTKYEIDLSDYTGESINLYFNSVSNWGNGDAYHYLDEIAIAPIPACRKVKNLEVSNVSPNGAQIDFQYADGSAHDAHVAISKEAAFDEESAILVDTVTADSSYYFNVALDYNTLYYIYVRQDCGEGETSEWSSISFRTDCRAIAALPWLEGFEEKTLGSSTSDAPECWALLNANEGGYPYVYVNNSTNYVQTGDQSLYFVSSSSLDAFAILPEFDVAMDSLQVSFSYRNEGVSTYNGTLSLGYMIDITKESSFVELVSCPQTTTFTTISVSTKSIPSALAHSVRLAFRYEGGSSNYYAAVDDIRINKLISASYSDEVCEGLDYVGADHGNAFYIDADSCHLGLNTFTKFIAATEGSGLPDSLLTLNLTVSAIQHYLDSITLCEGESYDQILHGKQFKIDSATLNMQPIVQFIENENGCEDVAELFITVLPKVEEHIYDTITQGETYEWHGESYISTTVATYVTSSLVNGCDSTVYLHLTVNPKEDQAVDYIYAQSLIIAPNPVKAGEPIHILNSFSAESLAEARIEILSATGALVYTQHGAEKPLIIPGVAVSGVYTVRIIIGHEIYISTLLVH